MIPKRALWVAVVLLVLAAAGCASDDSNDGPSGSIRIESNDDLVRIASSAAVVELERDPFRIALRSPRGDLLTRSSEAGFFFERSDQSPNERETLRRIASYREQQDGVVLDVETAEQMAVVDIRFLSDRTIEVIVRPREFREAVAVGAEFDSPRDELIYGLTERLRDSEPFLPVPGLEAGIDEVRPVETGSLNRRGETVQMRVRPTIAVYGPFYHSSRGYGLLVGGTTLGEFDVAATDPERIAIRFETGRAADSQQLHFYLFYGPDHPTILDEYTALTGRPAVPPDWAFLHWLWRGELVAAEPELLGSVPMNAQFVEDMTMYDRFGIPAGVYLFDRPVLEGEFGFARFAWDEERLPNVDAMLGALRDRGFKLATWSSMWACGSGPLDNGTEAQQLGLIAPGPDPSAPPRCGDTTNANFILDVTHPDVAEYWAAKVSDFVGIYGIQAIKLDRGEEHIPSTAGDIWADGSSGVEVRNLYPIVQAEIHQEALRRAFGDDSIVITRSAYTGTQRAAIVWGGDTPGSEDYGFGPGTDLGLRGAIINQLRCAFLGYPIWGSDTGGYYQFKHRDVFARWLQFSAFSGIMEIGGVGPQTPWNMPTEPTFDEEMIEIYRRYTSLRETLQDYIVAAAREAGASGMPIARPMVFAFPDDDRVLDMWDQYMFGPVLMVAPVWRMGDRSREVYFPRGRWTSYWDKTIAVEGPITMTVDVPLDAIPVYVRDDATVPRPEA